MNKEYFDEKFGHFDQKFSYFEGQFNYFREKFDGIDKKFDSIDNKFNSIDNKFDGINKRFDRFEEVVNERFDKVEFSIVSLGARVGSLEKDFKDFKHKTEYSLSDLSDGMEILMNNSVHKTTLLQKV